MNLKNFFEYKPNNKNNFIIPTSSNEASTSNETQDISENLNKNYDYLKVKYNLLLNSDINTREFEISVSDKTFKALLVSVDGITNIDTINNNILKPLMLFVVQFD